MDSSEQNRLNADYNLGQTLASAVESLVTISAHQKQRHQANGDDWFPDTSLAYLEFESGKLVGGAWSTDTIGDGLNQARMYQAQAEDYMRAIALVLRNTYIAFGAWSLARSALETLSLSWWLLDPKADYRERVFRSIRQRELSEIELWKSARDLGLPDTDPLSAFATRKRIEAMRSDGVALGMTIRPDNGNLDHARPKTTKLVTDHLDAVGEGKGATLYNLLSAVAHGHPYGLQVAVDFEGLTEEHRRAQLTFARHPEWMHAITGILLKAHGSVVARWLHLSGWDEPTWASECQQIWKATFPDGEGDHDFQFSDLVGS